MRIAYVDCFSGVSGDMLLGALVDAGVPLAVIGQGLRKLDLKGYRLRESKVKRCGIAATKVDVMLTAKGDRLKAKGRTWRDVQDIIRGAPLPEAIKKQGHAVFRVLFGAEAAVHGSAINRIHLHELGCVDCLVDIFGTLIGLAYLKTERICASPVNVGSGTTRTSHGLLPVPAPATAEILKGVPCHSSGPAFELATPTGAALLRSLASGFGPMPLFRTDTIGIGAGSADPADWPNVLRLMIGEEDGGMRGERVCVIETNIDDMNPQVYEHVMAGLFARGARDVFLTPVIMKKSRPGIVLTAVCDPERRMEISEVILRETSTIGLRFSEMERMTLHRELRSVRTRYGPVRVKVASGSGIRRATPEYDDCARLAAKAGIPVVEVMREAVRASERTAPKPKGRAGGR